MKEFAGTGNAKYTNTLLVSSIIPINACEHVQYKTGNQLLHILPGGPGGPDQDTDSITGHCCLFTPLSLTWFSDGQRELGPQLRLQVLVVVRISRGVKQTLVLAPEIDQQVVHRRAPVWPPDLTAKVCHVLGSMTPHPLCEY